MKKRLTNFLTIVLFVATIFLPLIVNWGEDGLRYYGWVLELLGTFLILLSLNERLKLFGSQTLLEKLISVFRTGKKTIQISGRTGGISISGRRLRVKVSPEKTLDGLLKHFSKEIDDLYQVIEIEKQDLTKDMTKLEKDLIERIQNLDHAVKQVRDKMTESMASNTGRELYGLTCFFCGITYATVPDLILRVIK